MYRLCYQYGYGGCTHHKACATIEDDQTVVCVDLGEGNTPCSVAQNANEDFGMICLG